MLEDSSSKSLVEQILDEMFDRVEEQNQFDEKTLYELKQLALSSLLKKTPEVIAVIKLAAEKAE